jgi:hypothetical protein
MIKKTAIIVTLVLIGAVCAWSQTYRYEIGPAIGVTGYLGDVNKSNMYKMPRVAGGGIFRYNLNSRFSFKGNLLYVNLAGDSKNLDSKFPFDEHYSFTSHMVDLGGQAEFNFFHFGDGPRYKHYKRITPYITAGLGAVMSFANGKTGFSAVLPLGVGVRFRLKERLNLGFEFTMRKAFGDKIDGISDLYGYSHGMAKNTDWYSVAMFTLTYEFSKRCVKCHYIE